MQYEMQYYGWGLLVFLVNTNYFQTYLPANKQDIFVSKTNALYTTTRMKPSTTMSIPRYKCWV